MRLNKRLESSIGLIAPALTKSLMVFGIKKTPICPFNRDSSLKPCGMVASLLCLMHNEFRKMAIYQKYRISNVQILGYDSCHN